jgi:hypothetical protein
LGRGILVFSYYLFLVGDVFLVGDARSEASFLPSVEFPSDRT